MTTDFAPKRRTDGLMAFAICADVGVAVVLFAIAPSLAVYAAGAVLAGAALVALTPRLAPRPQRVMHVGLLLACLVGGGGVMYAMGVLDSAISDGQRELDAVLALVRDGRMDQAYDELAPEIREQVSLAQFQKSMSQIPPAMLVLREQYVEGKSVQWEFGAGSRLSYTAEVVFGDGSRGKLLAEFFRHDGRWRVATFRLDDLEPN